MPDLLDNEPDKSGLAEPCLSNKYQPLESTSIISKLEVRWNRIILEDIFSRSESHDVNRNTGFNLSVGCGPALQLIGASKLSTECEVSGRFWKVQEATLIDLAKHK